MAASRRKQAGSAAGSIVTLVQPLQQVPLWLVVSIALICCCAFGAVFAWRAWEVGTVARSGTKLDTENIRVTPQPEWIRRDLREEAVRDGSLAELSILDKELTYKVYTAFEMQPWVAKVNRVSKQPPATVIVDLEYRYPVAWVEVPSFMSPLKQDSVLPISADAILLPTDDFTADDVENSLRIAVSDLLQWGPIGTQWPDARVIGAAQIAALLEQHYQAMGLHRVVVPAIVRGRPNDITYELATRSGHRIVWGSPPGREKSGEATAANKLQSLIQLAERIGSLEQLDQLQQVDLRQLEAPRDNRRTARRITSGPYQRSNRSPEPQP